MFSPDGYSSIDASRGAPLRVRLDCSFAGVRRGAAQVRAFLVAHGLTEEDIWACELAFVEGCNNAVQHTPANRAAKKLLIELSCQTTHVELRINDHTRGFKFPRDSALPPCDRERGRGIYLMRSLMDQVDYIRKPSSNCLILKKACTGI